MSKLTEKQMASMIEGLAKGDSLLVSARRTNNESKFQLEFAERIPQKGINTAAIFNASDDRFNLQPKPRRAWQGVEAAEMEKYFGISPDQFTDENMVEVAKKSTGESVKVLLIGKKNPIINVDGTDYIPRVRIVESTTPTEYQMENLADSVKKTKSDGQYLLANGKPIFSRATIQLVEKSKSSADHITVQHTELVDNLDDYLRNIPISDAATTVISKEVVSEEEVF